MRYRTIVVDPPWEYPGGVSFGGSRDKLHSFSLPYETLDIAQIATLPIPRLAEDDAWLFLWTTNRYLLKAFDLLHSWGFGYRQMMTWAKLGSVTIRRHIYA